MLEKALKKVFGSRSDREMNRLLPVVNEINQTAQTLQEKSDDELKIRTEEMMDQIASSKGQLETELVGKNTDPVEIKKDEIPVFWACGITPQIVAKTSKPPLMITHAPGHMFVTDLDNDKFLIDESILINSLEG